MIPDIENQLGKRIDVFIDSGWYLVHHQYCRIYREKNPVIRRRYDVSAFANKHWPLFNQKIRQLVSQTVIKIIRDPSIADKHFYPWPLIINQSRTMHYLIVPFTIRSWRNNPSYWNTTKFLMNLLGFCWHQVPNMADRLQHRSSGSVWYRAWAITTRAAQSVMPSAPSTSLTYRPNISPWTVKKPSHFHQLRNQSFAQTDSVMFFK